MDFDDLLISTGVDALIRLVKQKGEVENTLAAKLLNLPEETVNEWSQILEEQGIIKIKYKFTKTYLTWAEPTEAEIKKEIKTFKGKKSEITEKVKELKETLEPEKESLAKMRKEIQDLIKVLEPKINEIEKKTESIAGISISGKMGKEEKEKLQERTREISLKMSELKESLDFVKTQIERVRGELKSPKGLEIPNAIEKIRKDIIRLDADLQKLERRAEDRKGRKKAEETGAPVSKQYEELKKEFAVLRSQASDILDAVRTLRENKELVKNVDVDLSKRTKQVEELKTRLDSITQHLTIYQKQFNELSADIQAARRSLERMGDSFKITEDVFKEFPSPEELSEKIKSIENREKELGSKLKKLETIATEGGKAGEPLQKEYERIIKNIDEKKSQLSEEAAEISKRLDEESSTYQVFQKIKDRALSSIEEYNLQLESIKNQVKELDSEVSSLQKSMDKTISAKTGAKSEEIKEVIKEMEKLESKKKLLEEINALIPDLESKLDKISKRISLLSKQEQLIELRVGKGIISPEEAKEGENALINEVELTKKEQEDYKNKRKELMDMIKKLWEEG
ncbi:hypothetical protein JXB01_02505 [Candidatus Micrarchaeota archaeon]|nr:hypothetical protein [Candidatus Micrarchaeota archaeon]